MRGRIRRRERGRGRWCGAGGSAHRQEPAASGGRERAPVRVRNSSAGRHRSRVRQSVPCWAQSSHTDTRATGRKCWRGREGVAFQWALAGGRCRPGSRVGGGQLGWRHLRRDASSQSSRSTADARMPIAKASADTATHWWPAAMCTTARRSAGSSSASCFKPSRRHEEARCGQGPRPC